MKRFFSGLVVAVLILTFVVCIYCYGENRRFSLEYYIENISEIQSGIWLSSLGEVWTSNGYTISYPITDNRYEGSGADPGAVIMPEVLSASLSALTRARTRFSSFWIISAFSFSASALPFVSLGTLWSACLRTSDFFSRGMQP